MVAHRRFEYQLLITDDDDSFRQTLCAIFAPFFELLEARCGEEAIEIAEQTTVHLILLDMYMEEMTGLDTLIEIKSINELTPCILITADATEELRQQAAEADAFTVLKKPVLRKQLLQTVSTAMQDTYDDALPLD